MEIYKVSIKNKDLQLPFDALYFEEQKTAEAVINTINSLLVKGKVIEWECETVNAMSHKEALQQFMSIADELPD